MKKIIKSHIRAELLFSVCMAVFFISCEDKEQNTGNYDPSKPVVLTSFYPDSGKIATKILLDGDNFGTSTDDIKVYFNYKRSTVIGSTGKRMYAIVPKMPGDTCTVSVVVGKDSVVYDQKFFYKISVSVSTVAGNGTEAYNTTGNMAETTIKPAYCKVDAENNIFVTFYDPTTNFWGIAKFNEEENTVVTLVGAGSGGWVPMVPGVDIETGIISVTSDAVPELFYTMDPKDGWSPKLRRMRYLSTASLPTNPWKKVILPCPANGYLYTHFRDGHLFKIHPRTFEAELVGTFSPGDAYGSAFHPFNPNLLYMAFNGGSGENSHSIICLDVTASDPMATIRRLNSSTNGGYRDGDLSVALFRDPKQIQFDSEGNLYIADTGNHCIRRITTENRVETVLGIPGSAGWKDGGKEDAQFNSPWGLTVCEDGTIYVADYGNNRLRKLAIE